ncbi:MAG: hypothetical protein FK734_01620 [Asgard group archaeon]|nr:hypothetical protein [Asgard group archaeon]
MFSINEDLQSFNKVIEIFSKHDFKIQNFVDDHMCVLSREKDGFNEAVKIERNQIEIQAPKSTMEELSEELSLYYVR